MNTISKRITRSEASDLVIKVKELYREAIHGIIQDNSEVIDAKLSELIGKINSDDTIENKVNNFFKLSRMWVNKYVCNINVLQAIYSRISLESIRGIHIHLYNNRSVLV